MRKYLFIILLVICCNTFAGEGNELGRELFTSIIQRMYSEYKEDVKANIGLSVFDGHVISNEQNMAYFRFIVSNDNVNNPDIVIWLTEKVDGQDKGFYLQPAIVEKMAKELEPYLMLFERGRKISEEIIIDENRVMSVKADGIFSFTITSKIANSSITFSGDNAILFVKNFIQAEKDSRTWVVGEFAHIITERINASKQASPQATKQDVAPQNPIEDGFLNLKTLDYDYSTNEIAANKKYAPFIGKRIKIKATVEKVAAGNMFIKGTTVHFKESVGFISITCQLANNVSTEDVAALLPGQQIMVEGIWQGKPQILKPSIIDAQIINGE